MLAGTGSATLSHSSGGTDSVVVVDNRAEIRDVEKRLAIRAANIEHPERTEAADVEETDR